MKDYNFFELYDKKRRNSINPRSVTFIGLILLIVFLLLSLGFVGRNFYLSHQISSLVTETEQLKTRSEYIQAQKLKTSVDAMKEYDENAEIALDKFKSVNTLGTSTLSKISSAIPVGVSLNSIAMDHAVTYFIFNIPDRKAAAELMVNLKGLDIFVDVHLVSIIQNKDDVLYSASIECVMKEGEKFE